LLIDEGIDKHNVKPLCKAPFAASRLWSCLWDEWW